MNGATHSLFEFYLRAIAQLFYCGCDVTAPVTLFHYIILVVVQGTYLSCDVRDVLSKESHKTKNPQRCRYAYPPRITQLLTYEIAEGGRTVHLTVAKEVRTSANVTLYGKEDSLNNVGDIHEWGL